MAFVRPEAVEYWVWNLDCLQGVRERMGRQVIKLANVTYYPRSLIYSQGKNLVSVINYVEYKVEKGIVKLGRLENKIEERDERRLLKNQAIEGDRANNNS